MTALDLTRSRAAALCFLSITVLLSCACGGGTSNDATATDPNGAPVEGNAGAGEPAAGTGAPDDAVHGGTQGGGERTAGDPHEDLPFFRGAGSAQGEGGGGTSLAWTDPEGWIPVEPASRMRWAQYALPAPGRAEGEGECVVFYFGPGQGGDAQSNAERWAGQFQDASGAPPKPAIEQSEVGGRKVMKVTVEGTYAPSPMTGGEPSPPKPGHKLLGAVVEGPDANWFFKCTGPAATMDAHRSAFDGLIASIRSR